MGYFRASHNTAIIQDKDMEELAKRGGVQGLAHLLACETSTGLGSKVEGDASIEGRARLFGENRLPPVPPVSFWMLMVSQMHLRFLKLLWYHEMHAYRYCVPSEMIACHKALLRPILKHSAACQTI